LVKKKTNLTIKVLFCWCC